MQFGTKALMAKPYSVTPFLRPKTRCYVATFRTASGKRTTGGLGTPELDRARIICSELVLLKNQGARSLADVPADMILKPRTIELYFETKLKRRPDERKVPDAGAALEAIEPELAAYPRNVWRFVTPLLLDRARLSSQNTLQAERLSLLKQDLDDKTAELEALSRSILAKVAESTRSIPHLPEALEQYETHLRTVQTPASAASHVALARRFVETLPTGMKTAADIRPEAVAKFLDEETQRTDPDKPLARRRNLHIRLARFLNWSAETWQYPSPMTAVQAVTRKALRRERGEIRWHELPDVEAVVAALDSEYWRALVATLAYAGLQLAELAWLRKTDLHLNGGRGRIWVGPVEDPTADGARHLLKTANRERHVDVHPRLLLPRLQAHLDAGGAGELYLFPMPADRRRRTREAEGHPERWRPETLSTVLRGHKGGSDPKKRPPQPGILPAGMTAASLRRTFGSLLLRSGKTTAQVAAAMGNTEDVVREHYARLLGCEVDVDF